MSLGPASREQIDRFLVDEIDSVPQLEALLLFWNRRPKRWYLSEIAKSLYISHSVTVEVVKHLTQHRLISKVGGGADCYELNLEDEEKEQLLEGLDVMYRQELVRVSNLIHEKASRAVRDFASAFRFKKDERK